MKKKVLTVGGGKGGIGKSLGAGTSVAALLAKDIKVTARETDTTNSSLRQMGLCDHEPWDLKDAAAQGGMAGLIDLFADGYDGNVVIDLGARDEEIFLDYVDWFQEQLSNHGAQLIWLRPITLNIYTAEGAVEFADRFPTIPQIVLLNLGQGRKRRDFELWDASEPRQKVLKGLAVEMDFEDFSTIIADTASSLGLSFGAIVDGDFTQVDEAMRPFAEAVYTAERRRFVKLYLDRHYTRLVKAIGALEGKGA